MVGIEIKNFQALRDVKLEFDKCCFIVGLNDTGKSSLCRAIYSAIYNKSTVDYISYLDKEFKIRLNMDFLNLDFEYVRNEKGKIYYYDRIKDEKYERLNKLYPPFIPEILYPITIDDKDLYLNFHFQFEPIFLINDVAYNSAFKFKYFSNFIDYDFRKLIDLVKEDQKYLKEEININSIKLDEVNKNIKEIEENISFIDRFCEEKFNTFYVTFNELYEYYEKLSEYNEKYQVKVKDYRNKIILYEQYNGYDKSIDKIKKVVKVYEYKLKLDKIKKLYDVEDTYREINVGVSKFDYGIFDLYNKCKKLNTYKNMGVEYLKILMYMKFINNMKEIIEKKAKIGRYIKIKKEIEEMKKKIEEGEKSIEEANKKYMDILKEYGKCPVCKRGL